MDRFGGYDYLVAHVLGGRNVRAVFGSSEGAAAAAETVIIQLLRDWVAARLQVDFDRANAGLASQYGHFFPYVDGEDRVQRQRVWLEQVREPGGWDREEAIGDTIIEIVAAELGVPMAVIRPDYAAVST